MSVRLSYIGVQKEEKEILLHQKNSIKMNDKAKELYSYLKSQNMTDLDENTFINKYSDPSKSAEIHSYLKSQNMTDLDASSFHSSYFGGVKKKDSTPPKKTDSFFSSATKMVDASLATSKPKTAQKPLESSSKVDDSKYYKVSGNEKATYKKSNGEWTVDVNSTGKFQPLTKGDVNARVKNLEQNAVLDEDITYYKNKSIGKILGANTEDQSASELLRGKVFTGFPGKEENKYRIIDNKWQYSRPSEGGYTKWADVTNDQSIKALSTQFNELGKLDVSKNIDYISEFKAKNVLGEKATEEELTTKQTYYKNIEKQKILRASGYDVPLNGDLKDPKTVAAFKLFDAKMEAKSASNNKESQLNDKIDLVVNNTLINNDEENVVAKLRAKFGKDGFIFDESGIGDAITVSYSIDGVQETDPISIDLQSLYSDEEEMNKLKSYMKTKHVGDFERNIIGADNSDTPLTTEEKVKHYKDLTKLMAKNPLKYGKELISEDGGEIDNIISEGYSDIKAKYIGLEDDAKKIEEKVAQYNANPTKELELSINNDVNRLKQKEYQLKRDANDLKGIESNYAKAVGSYVNSESKSGNFLGGLSASFVKGLTSIPKALLNVSADVLPLAVDNYGLNSVEYEKLKQEGLSDDDIYNKVSSSLKRSVVDDVQKGIVNIGSLGTTTEEYLGSEDRGMVSQAVNALAESIGANISGGGNPMLQKLAFFSQSYNDMESQMSGTEFDDMSAIEKKGISILYGIGIGQLEKLGFDVSSGIGTNKIVQKFINYTVGKTLKDLPKNASIHLIEETISKNIKANLISNGIKVVAGGLSEATPEFVQSISEVGLKNVVNAIHDKEYFQDVPDLTTAEGLKEALSLASHDAIIGGLGGSIMGSYSTYQSNKTTSTADKDFELMRASLIDPALLKSVKMDTAQRLRKGELTKEEAQSEIRNINKSVSILNKIPTDISNRGARVSYELLSEKETLEQQILNKDKNLVVKQQARIDEINGQLENITETIKNMPEPIEVEATPIEKTEVITTPIDPTKVEGEKVVPVGKRLFNDPNIETKAISKAYKESKGIKTSEGSNIESVDIPNAMKIADAFDALEDTPNDPIVQKAYSDMATETADQHKSIVDAGYDVEIWEGDGEPYANAEAMISDLRDNKHMYIYSTEVGFGDTPITNEQRNQNKLLQDSGYKDKNGKTLLYNDVFRFVHDFFGHSERGNGFGAIGEENAWDVHSRMYSPLAKRAMTTETRGQNSWVNFGPQMRNADGTLVKKGDQGYKEAKDREFAPQKMGLLPEEFSQSLDDVKVDKEVVQLSESISNNDDIQEVLKDATNLKRASDFLKNIEDSLDQFGKETLGMNLPVAVAKVVVKTIRTLVDAGVSLEQAIKQASKEHNVSEEDIYDTLNVKPSKKSASIKEAITKAKENDISDAAIRKYLKNEGYTDKQATDEINKFNIKSEDIWTKGEEGIINSLKYFKKKLFSARAFLPISVRNAIENKNATIAFHKNIIARNVADFNRLYRKYDGDKEQLLKDFDQYIRGERYKNNEDSTKSDREIELPTDFKILANSMRNQIDGLSRQLIASGAVDVDKIETIKANLGKYLTRSYEMYDNKNWKKDVKDNVRQAAINYLRVQYKSYAENVSERNDQPFEDVLNAKVEQEMANIFPIEAKGNFKNKSKEGSKDLSILKSKKEIPTEIRALMGEYEDPTLNYAATVTKLAELTLNHKFLSDIKELGMGKYFFEKDDMRAPKDFHVEIAPTGSNTMSPLNGLMTTKEIADAFMKEANGLNDFMKVVMGIQGAIRYSKTILSVATHAKNLVGNFGFMWTNLHLKPNEIGRAMRIIHGDLWNKSTDVRKAKMDEYIKAGVVKQSAGLGEIMDMFKDANFDISMASRLSKKKVGTLGKLKRVIFQGKKFIEDSYQAEDDFFKIIAYEHEMNRYSDAMYDKKREDLTEDEYKKVQEKVSEIVKNIYPTYDRIPELIKMVRRTPLIGNFVSFTAESYRTAWNTLALATEEMKDESTRAIGAKRIIGASTYVSAKSALLIYMSNKAGAGFTGLLGYLFDDEEEKKRDADIKSFLPPWSRNSDVLLLDVGDGKIQYIDFSATDPHGSMKKVLNAFFSGKTGIDGFIDGAIAVFEPFIGKDMAVEAALALDSNRNKYGDTIYNPEDTEAKKTSKIMGYLYDLVKPGTAASVERIVESESKGAEIAANLTGFRISEIDVTKQFGFGMSELADRMKNANKIYNSAYYNDKASEADKKQAYKEANARSKEIMKEMSDLYDSAERLGSDPKLLIESMSSAQNQLSAKEIKEIQSREYSDLKLKEDKDKKKVEAYW
jgi:hypothetical protein